jgi:hypothetical protein
MRCQRALANVVRPVLCLALLSGAAGACSGGGSGVASAQSADALIRMEMNDLGVSVENKTGTSIVSGQVTLVAGGTRPPFFVMLPRIESGGKRTFGLDTFRTSDGTPFRRGLVRARAVRISANDLNGKAHEYEIPFQ